jgi:hypothetical protein
MTEWGMSKVVAEARSLHDVWIEMILESAVSRAESLGNASADLGNFKAVRKAVVDGKPLIGRDDLGNAAQSAKSRGVEDSIAVLAGSRPVITLIRLDCRVKAVESAHGTVGALLVMELTCRA